MLELVSLHDKQAEFLEREWILEQFDVLQEGVFNKDVPKCPLLLDFFPLDNCRAHTHDCLLHFFGLLYALVD